MKLCWPAPERNKGPILEVLERFLPPHARVLEIASGTGQHVEHFASNLNGTKWIPSDIDPANLESLRICALESEGSIDAPIELDVRTASWGVGEVDAIVCSNMIHIAPWECTLGLLEGASRHIREAGIFVLYGPFRVGNSHTAPSNEAFDLDLRSRNPSWGVRDFEAVAELAEAGGFVLLEKITMPANNFALVFEKRAKAQNDVRR